MKQFDRKIFQQALAFIVFMTSATQTWAATPGEQAQEKVTAPQDRLTPTASGKDVKSGTIRFSAANPEDPEQQAEFEYQIDPTKITPISKLRQQLMAEQAESAEVYKFLRAQMGMRPEVEDAAVLMSYLMINKHTQEELERQFDLKYQNNKTIFKNAVRRTMSFSPHGFASQTVLFGVAQGAVTFLQCQRQYAYNPTCMDHLIQGFKDPIGQIAFSSFIVANGFTSDILTRGTINALTGPVTWKSKMLTSASFKQAIPYLGMTAGMLASNLSAEVLNLMTTCAKTMFARENSEQAAMAAAMAGMGGAQADPCDAAQKEFFNLENKVEQYIPMLLSMMASTAVLMKVGTGIQKAKWLAATAKEADFAKRMAGKQIFKLAEKGAKPALRIIGATLALQVTPAGWILDGMTIGSVAVNILQNAGFIALDHVFTPLMNKAWAQVWRAWNVDGADEKVRDFFLANKAGGWDQKNTYAQSVKEGKGRSTEATKNLVGALAKFREEMDAWRTINNAEVFTGLQAWTEISHSMIKEVNAAEVFYNDYITKVFETFKYRIKSQTPAGLNQIEKDKFTSLPFRKYPLFGVTPTGYVQCKNDAKGSDDDSTCISGELELYTKYPDQLEKYQLNTIHAQVEALENSLQKDLKPGFFASKASEEGLKQILKELKSDSAESVGRTLDKLNTVMMSNGLKDENATKLLYVFRKSLGNPRPIWEAGVMMPGFFESQMSETHAFDGLENKDKLGYKFSSHTEYLMYQMMCGPESKASDKILKETWGFKPKFNPPRITTNNLVEVEWPKAYVDHQNSLGLQMQYRTSLCVPAQVIPFALLYKSKIYENGSKTGVPFMEFLGTHIQPEILGNWKDTAEKSTSAYQEWWNKTISAPMFALFKRMDQEFQPLLIGLAKSLNQETFFESPSFMDFLAQSVPKVIEKGLDRMIRIQTWGTVSLPYTFKGKLTDASRALVKAHVQEINTYLTVLGEIEHLQDKRYSPKTIMLDPNKTLLSQMNHELRMTITSQKDFVTHLKFMVSAMEGMRIGQVTDLYDRLGVKTTASAQEIATAYQAQVAKTLKEGDPNSRDTKEKLELLEEARLTLGTASLREIYDSPKAILPVKMEKFNDEYDAMVKALKDYQAYLAQFKMSDYQKSIVAEAMNGLSKSSMMLGVYIFNTELTKFSASKAMSEMVRNCNRVFETMADKGNKGTQSGPWRH